MYLVVASEEDMASMNIRRAVLGHADWEERGTFDGNPVLWLKERALLVTIKESHLYSDDIDRRASEALATSMPDNVIFLSRHKSESGLRTLTVHPLGCYGKADYGGRDGTLVPSAPGPMTAALRLVHKHATARKFDFKVSFECTHHGPYLETPTFFIEIGSSEDAWVEEEPAEVLALTILELIEDKGAIQEQLQFPIAIGAGGGHYAPRLTDVALGRKVSFGHMVPSYALDNPDEALAQAVGKTPKVSLIYFHRKALKGGNYRRLKDLFTSLGLEVVREKDLESFD
jgi:D-aminoacyl-tRNA deacylase